MLAAGNEPVIRQMQNESEQHRDIAMKCWKELRGTAGFYALPEKSKSLILHTIRVAIAQCTEFLRSTIPFDSQDRYNCARRDSTSVRWGIAGAVPWRVTEIPATAQPN